MHYRPFRFGVATGSAHSRAEWESRARRAEELGYATLVVADHLTTGLAPLSALAVAAGATTRLRIGSLVFNNDFRHPALLAKEAATMDILSNGRFELGLGAGWHKGEYDAVGLSFDPPGVRARRFEEARAAFVRALAIRPDDGPSQTYVERCDIFLADPPPADWDGVWHMKEK